MDVSVCIVAYNALDKLRACLDSLAEQATRRAVEVIVVDNASAEPVADTVARDYPAVRLIRSEANLGFAAGTNRALAAAAGRYLWWLNPDTVLPTPDTLEALVDRLEAKPEVAFLGCRLELADGTTQQVSRGLPRVGDEVLDLLHLRAARPPSGPLSPRERVGVRADGGTEGTASGDPEPSPRPSPGGRGGAEGGAEALGVTPAAFVTGACLLTRREVQEEVGPLAEDYFMYFEDVDWCRRALAKGLRGAVCEGVTVRHHEGASFGGRAFARRELYYRGLLRYLRRHDGRGAAALLRLVLAVTGLPKLLAAALLDHSPDRAARLSLHRTQLLLGLRGC